MSSRMQISPILCWCRCCFCCCRRPPPYAVRCVANRVALLTFWLLYLIANKWKRNERNQRKNWTQSRQNFTAYGKVVFVWLLRFMYSWFSYFIFRFLSAQIGAFNLISVTPPFIIPPSYTLHTYIYKHTHARAFSHAQSIHLYMEAERQRQKVQ